MSVAWFDGVTVTVEVAFTTAPLASSPSWTDVSDYVRGYSINRGRSDEFSKFGPGTASVTFSNRDRRFDPEYAAGAYFGNLNPMKKIRIRATYSAVAYDLFVGFVQGWPQDYEFTFDSTVTVQCVDGSRILESSTLNRSAYEAAVTIDAPMLYWPLQQQNSSGSSDWVDVVIGQTLSQSGFTFASGSGSDVVGADGYIVPVYDADVGQTHGLIDWGGSGPTDAPAAPLAMDCWVYLSSAPLTSYSAVTIGSGFFDTIGVYVDSDNTWDISWSNTSLNRFAQYSSTTPVVRGRWHHIAVIGALGTVKFYLNGVEVSSTATSVGTSAFGLETRRVANAADDTDLLAHVAFYSTAPSAARIQEHYLAGLTAYGHPYGERTGARIGRVLDEIGWPAADRTLSTGDTVHGPYIPDRQSAMGYMQDAETAEDGYLFIGDNGNVIFRSRSWQWLQASVGTFSDDGSNIPYESITIDANSLEPLRTAVSVTYGANDAYLKVEDATTKAAYGPALEALSTPTLADSYTARQLANYRLRAWKNPSTRITELTVQPRAKAATAYPVILNLELGDRITVERTPGNPVVGSQIVKSLTVQGIRHDVDVEGRWTTTLYLSPAPALATAVPYFIVGDATYGRLGAAAGNKIPF
jgi:hypothetical protein